MPIYVYQCLRCEQQFEEIQRLGDLAPDRPEDCPRGSEPNPCPLERVITTAHHRFKDELSSDGIGGYERQGDFMIRQTKGRNTTRYGEGSV